MGHPDLFGDVGEVRHPPIFESLSSNRLTVKLGQRESGECFAVVGSLVTEDGEDDRFSEQQSCDTVTAPVHASRVATTRNVGGELVQFSANGERRPVIGN